MSKEEKKKAEELAKSVMQAVTGCYTNQTVRVKS